MEKFLTRGIKAGLFLVLLTPLFFAQSFIYPFVTPKVFVFQAIVELILGLWLGLVIFYPAYRPKLTKLTWAVLIFLFVLTLSAVFGIDAHRSFWSTQDRGLGLVSLFHFGILFLVLANFRDKLNWRRYFIFGFLVSLFASLFAVVQLYFPEFFLEPSSGRPGSFLGNPAFLASYLVFNVFIGLWLLSEQKKEKPKLYNLTTGVMFLGVLFEIFVILITKTRGAILGLALGLIVFFLYLLFLNREVDYFGFSKKRLKVISAIFLGPILLFGVGFLTTRNNSLWLKVPVLNRFANISLDSPDAQTRLIAWKIAWESFKDRPILGFGFENFKYPFDKHYNPKLLRYGFGETHFDKPHNVFLEYLVVSGVLGFLAYMFLAFTWIKGFVSFRKLRRFVPFGLGLVAAYLGQNFFIFDTFGSYLLLFIVLAFVDANDPKREFEKKELGGVLTWPKESKRLLAVGLILATLLPVYFLNIKSLYMNNRQYWGLNYFFNKLPNEAISAYAQALNTAHPYRDETRENFASALVSTFRQGVEIPEIELVSGQAMMGLAQAINNHPNNFFLRYTFADLSTTFYIFDSRYLKEANNQITESLKISPSRQSIYYIGAKIKIIEGRKEEAVAMIKKAVDLDPEVGDPHFYYGLIALQAGKNELGFSEIEKADKLGRKPIDFGEMRVLANFYGEAERYDEAIQLYKNALGLNPGDLDSRLKLGLVYYFNGEKSLAREKILEVMSKFDLTTSGAYQDILPILKNLGLAS